MGNLLESWKQNLGGFVGWLVRWLVGCCEKNMLLNDMLLNHSETIFGYFAFERSLFVR